MPPCSTLRNAPWEPGSHFLRGYRLTPVFLHESASCFPLSVKSHMYTYTHNRRPCSSSLGEGIPTLAANQSGHVCLQIPKERKLTGHLEPDTQPNLDSAALSKSGNQQILPQTMTHFPFLLQQRVSSSRSSR